MIYFTTLVAAALSLSDINAVAQKAAAHYQALESQARTEAREEGGELKAPRTYQADAKRLVRVPVTDWTSGHFAGSLWYLAELTGDTVWVDRAKEWTESHRRASTITTHHDIGFIIFCSYGNAWRLGKGADYEEIIRTAAQSLSVRFNPRLGLIRSWGPIDDTRSFSVIPDNLMNLEMLEWAAKHTPGVDGERFDVIARSHADVTMRNHFRADGGCYHVLDYCQKDGRVQEIRRGQGLGCTTAWSRGQSWGIYGYTMMYRETKDEKYLRFAEKLADYAIHHPNMPADGVPYWDYGAPGEERDTSAAAVMASALVELSAYVAEPKATDYFNFALRQVQSLSSPAYFSQNDEIGHFLLKHAVGHKPEGKEIDVPLVYGDYYFLEALSRIKRRMTHE